ncbi:NACHT domain-containing protein [Myroides odoratimimus]|uniref:hypothetical protein n=1 Tax=Myroides odoratimimus TaxID=76832 RepID=UPI002DBC2614|nr:hypothetical protein [Myroides odoratimimus]MEC4086235.1 hypothetical protein [Myroides odoratimimus]
MNFFKKSMSFITSLFNKRIISVWNNNNSEINIIEEQTIVEKKKISEEKLIIALKEQNCNQIETQINSGKYLQDTFLEVGNTKDELRYFCSSIFYSDKIFDIIKILDFRYLNIALAREHEDIFSLEIDAFLLEKKVLSINESIEYFTKLHSHLKAKKEIITSHQKLKNIKSAFEFKIQDIIQSTEFFKSKTMLITEMAGQGKTNFLCDFVEFFILKKGIPCVFLTGIELDSNDIRKSIIRRIFPDEENIEFSSILETVENICSKNNEYFIIIIDGINENYNSKQFAKNVELFISDMQKYNFVKIVLSCRSEYYSDNFSNFENASFFKDLIRIETLMKRNLEKEILEKLFNTYLEHFNIDFKYITNNVKKQLLSNFLLFRIFCETYKDNQFETIDNIYKEELFNNYYTTKINEINIRLSTINSSTMMSNIDIRIFLKKVIKNMITKKQYSNIVLDEILDSKDNRELYIRFLDENVLIKRDLVSASIFGTREVVNFTFDEFRDFLISDYLISELYQSEKDKFIVFLDEEITKNSVLMEGCSTFLFFKSRKTSDFVLRDIIQEQKWFSKVFSNCIFNVPDAEIIENDLKNLEKIFFDSHFFKGNVIINLIFNEKSKNLNIDFLISILLKMNKDEFKFNFTNYFGINDREKNKINQNKLIETFKKYTDYSYGSYTHRFFELLIYMFLNNNQIIIKMYEQYYFKNEEIGKKQLSRALNISKNTDLKIEIENFIKRYGISI